MSGAWIICGSRGPRIGEEGVPRCAQRIGHDGPHRGFVGSGFERETWGPPTLRDGDFALEWFSLQGAPED